jgi:hypothetical protein
MRKNLKQSSVFQKKFEKKSFHDKNPTSQRYDESRAAAKVFSASR